MLRPADDRGQILAGKTKVDVRVGVQLAGTHDADDRGARLAADVHFAQRPPDQRAVRRQGHPGQVQQARGAVQLGDDAGVGRWLVQRSVEFLVNGVRKVLDFNGRQVQMHQRLAGDLQPGFKLRLNHLVHAAVVQRAHVLKALGPGHDVQPRLQLANLIHDALGRNDGRRGDQQQLGIGDAGGFQHDPLAGVARNDRPAGGLGLLHAPGVELDDHEPHLEAPQHLRHALAHPAAACNHHVVAQPPFGQIDRLQRLEPEPPPAQGVQRRREA